MIVKLKPSLVNKRVLTWTSRHIEPNNIYHSIILDCQSVTFGLFVDGPINHSACRVHSHYVNQSNCWTTHICKSSRASLLQTMSSSHAVNCAQSWSVTLPASKLIDNHNIVKARLHAIKRRQALATKWPLLPAVVNSSLKSQCSGNKLFIHSDSKHTQTPVAFRNYTTINLTQRRSHSYEAQGTVLFSKALSVKLCNGAYVNRRPRSLFIGSYSVLSSRTTQNSRIYQQHWSITTFVTFSARLIQWPTSSSLSSTSNVQGVSFKRMGQGSSCAPNKNNSHSASGSPADGGKESSTDPVGVVVCSTEGFNDGDKREVEVGDTKVLLIKDGGQFYAVGNKCTHYGAPLSKGSYCNGVVRCPWHGACFNIKTGDIEDFPGLDSLYTYKVELRGKDVVVIADPASAGNFRRVRPMVKRVSTDHTSVVIVGGGPASVVCAETLRQEGFTGAITLVSKEKSLPYDRIKLSKALSVKPEEIALRSFEFYKDNDIEVMLGKEVAQVDSASNEIILSGGERLHYTSLVLATGGKPRRPNIPGVDLDNIFVLRTVEDANNIAGNIKDKNVIVLGSSFIGLEVASFMVGKAASVKLIGHSKVPLSNVFGEDIGLWFKQLHESKGVEFHCGTSIEQFVGTDGRLSSVKLGDGTELSADVCIMGVGVTPSTEFLKNSELLLTDRGYVTVDKSMRTNVKNVYAAGDITHFPLDCMGGNSVNIQHWQMAHQHGRIAGLEIAGKGCAIKSIPYFWTVQYGKSVRYAGYSHGYDELVLHGDPAKNKFVAFYIKNQTVVAAASLGWDPIVSQFADLLSRGDSFPEQLARGDPRTWSEKLY